MSRILIKDGPVLLEHLLLAETTATRMKGLLGRKSLSPDTGMLIRPCRSIHMWFMRFPIDAAFLDKDLQIIRIVRNLQPWQLAFAPGRTTCVLETTAHVLNGVKPGDMLKID